MRTNIAIAGNPNCGKTTLFNELTGASQYVGNWPGVTVEKKEGKYRRDKEVTLTDLPGVYSLSPYTPEEVVTRDYLMSDSPDAVINAPDLVSDASAVAIDAPDAVINIIDATNLERNLYLTTQILDIGLPTVVALNMMDLIEKNGDKIDVAELSKHIGCPVVEISALRNRGVDELVDKAIDCAKNLTQPTSDLPFAPTVEEALGSIIDVISGKVPERELRWYAIKLLEGDELTLEKCDLNAEDLARIVVIRENLESEMDDDVVSIIANERYDAISTVCDLCFDRTQQGLTTTQKIDRVVTNRIAGIPIFIAVMFFVYYLAVSIGGGIVTDWANDGLFGEGWFYALDGDQGIWIPGLSPVATEALESIGVAPWLISLVVDGIIAGVGAVIGFIPQMIILFLLLGFLEGCGYMARVAFIMDRIFRRFGLSGKSFIPMLIASGCGVPAVMSTKTIENEKDRRMTIMTTTMIPCGAKLPIIALVFGALAGADYEGVWWVAPLFYFLGLAAIIVSCIMLKKLKAFAGNVAPFIMELPQYHLPTVKSVLLSMWERVKSYIVKAGTIIFLSTIVIWFLMNFGIYEGTFGLLDSEEDGYLNYSLMAGLGNLLAWVFVPLGFGNWESTVTSITGLVAKENVVATVGILSSLGEVGETDPSLWAGFGAMLADGGVLTSVAVMSFCAFNLLCAPCFAAIGTIRRQMASAKWTWATIGYMTVFAWCVSLMIYQIGGVLCGEVTFSFWTIVAFAVLAIMLFLLFRPTPKYAYEDAAISTRNAEGDHDAQQGAAA